MSNARPNRRLPQRVYWVRRLVVLIVLAAVVALGTLTVTWISRLVRGDDAVTAAGTDPAGPAAQPQAPATSAGTQDCAPDAIGLTLTADMASYPKTGQPILTTRIVNNGPTACLVDAGAAQREVVITSGADRIWSSRDCSTPETQVNELLLGPAGSTTAAYAATEQWARTRSAAGCPADQAAALAGTYSASLTLGTVAAQPVVFVLD